MLKIAASILALQYITFSFAALTVEELLPISECACLLQNVTYQCTVCGGIFTVWKFPNHENCGITLRHADPLGTQLATECSSVTAVAQGLSKSVNNGCYTSELTVLVRPSTTIECVADDGVNDVVNSSELIISSGSLPPPLNISLIGITGESGMVNMTFNWQPPLRNCPIIGYSISPNDCGICTNINTTSIPQTISCENVDLPKNCMVTVESHMCANFSIRGKSTSEPLFINLEVPNSPVVANICTYLSGDSNHIMLRSTFFQVEPINISEGIDGSANSYTIIYFNSASRITCGEDTIPASECQNQICRHLFNVSVSSCTPDTNISVTVYATNMLGDGSISIPINQIISCTDMARGLNATHNKDNTATIIASAVPVSLIIIIAVITVPAIIVLWICTCLKNRKSEDTLLEFELPDIKTIEDSKWVPLDQYCEVKEVENNSKMLGFCDTLKKNIGKSQIKLGFLYYEWKKEASIIGKGEVVVYSKTKNTVFFCQRRKYDNVGKFHPPDLANTGWDAIFVQCFSKNRLLVEGTRVLYCIPPTLLKIENFRVFEVKEKIKMVEFAKKSKIHNYDQSSGHGYYQFTRSEFISDDNKILLMNKNEEVFTGPGVYRIVPVCFHSVETDPPNFPTDSEWKCAFVQSVSTWAELQRDTQFIYWRGDIAK